MNNYLPSNLKHLRKINNKSLKDVSTNIGKSIQAVQFWEAGSREPNISDIKKLCIYYQVSADELLSKDLKLSNNHYDVKNYFSNNLKYLRLSRGFNQEELSQKFNKDYSTIGKWENGTRTPTMLDTLEICKFFNVDLNDLIFKDLKMESNEKSHELNKLILDNLKELSDSDKHFIIKMIERLKK